MLLRIEPPPFDSGLPPPPFCEEPRERGDAQDGLDELAALAAAASVTVARATGAR